MAVPEFFDEKFSDSEAQKRSFSFCVSFFLTIYIYIYIDIYIKTKEKNKGNKFLGSFFFEYPLRDLIRLNWAVKLV